MRRTGMRISRLTSDREYYHQSRTDPSVHILPYVEVENFACDSSNVRDIGLTLINYSEDDKYHYIKYYNEKGIVNTFKKKKALK